MFSTPFRAYERQIPEQFTTMFNGAGFKLEPQYRGYHSERLGHAYLSPQPGFFFGRDGRPGPGDVIRPNPHERLSFANSDLAGIMDHRTSILEARRAVNQISDKIA